MAPDAGADECPQAMFDLDWEPEVARSRMPQGDIVVFELAAYIPNYSQQEISVGSVGAPQQDWLVVYTSLGPGKTLQMRAMTDQPELAAEDFYAFSITIGSSTGCLLGTVNARLSVVD